MRALVRGIRRFPVKSTGGETVQHAEVDARGFVGDRGWAIYDAEGRMASGKNTRRFRRMDAVFGLDSRLLPGETQPQIRVAAGSWLGAGSAEAAAAVSTHLGETVQLRPEREAVHFDGGAVSLIGTASLAALGALRGEGATDSRHFRSNLLLNTDEAWVEESWIGQTLLIGEVRLRVLEQVERCRTIDLAQDGASAHRGLLKSVGACRNMCAGMYAEVLEPGTVRLGDSVV